MHFPQVNHASGVDASDVLTLHNPECYNSNERPKGVLLPLYSPTNWINEPHLTNTEFLSIWYPLAIASTKFQSSPINHVTQRAREHSRTFGTLITKVKGYLVGTRQVDMNRHFVPIQGLDTGSTVVDEEQDSASDSSRHRFGEHFPFQSSRKSVFSDVSVGSTGKDSMVPQTKRMVVSCNALPRLDHHTESFESSVGTEQLSEEPRGLELLTQHAIAVTNTRSQIKSPFSYAVIDERDESSETEAEGSRLHHFELEDGHTLFHTFFYTLNRIWRGFQVMGGTTHRN